MTDSLEVQFNALLRLNTEVELKLYPSLLIPLILPNKQSYSV